MKQEGSVAPSMGGEWRDNAACLGMDTNLFFPSGKSDPALQEAKAICEECPVAIECLTYAIEADEKYGVWGGKTETERQTIRRRRARNRAQLTRAALYNEASTAS